MSEIKRKTEKQFNQIDKIAKKGKDQIYEYYKLVDEFINKGEYGYFEQTLSLYYNIDIVDYKGVDDVKRKTWPIILFQTNSSFQTKLKKMYDSKKVYQTSFDIYSQDIGHIQVPLSGPLGSTYSPISSTQSISIVNSSGQFYFETTDTDIFKVDIYQTKWVDVNGTEVPSTRRLIDQISVIATQSSYKTQIPAYESQYLVSVSTRPPLVVTNYKLELINDSYLGQIKEFEEYTPDVKYLIENMEFAKLMNQRKAYLEVTKGNTVYIIDSATHSNPSSLPSSVGVVYVVVPDVSQIEDQNLLNRYSAAVDILLS